MVSQQKTLRTGRSNVVGRGKKNAQDATTTPPPELANEPNRVPKNWNGESPSRVRKTYGDGTNGILVAYKPKSILF